MGSSKVSLRRDVLRSVAATREALARDLGFTPSYSDTVAYLIGHQRVPTRPTGPPRP